MVSRQARLLELLLAALFWSLQFFWYVFHLQPTVFGVGAHPTLPECVLQIVYFTACTRRKKVKMQRSKTIRTHQPAQSDRRGTLANPGFGDLVIAPSRPGRRRVSSEALIRLPCLLAHALNGVSQVTNARHTATVSPSEMVRRRSHCIVVCRLVLLSGE